MVRDTCAYRTENYEEYKKPDKKLTAVFINLNG